MSRAMTVGVRHAWIARGLVPRSSHMRPNSIDSVVTVGRSLRLSLGLSESKGSIVKVASSPRPVTATWVTVRGGASSLCPRGNQERGPRAVMTDTCIVPMLASPSNAATHRRRPGRSNLVTTVPSRNRPSRSLTRRRPADAALVARRAAGSGR